MKKKISQSNISIQRSYFLQKLSSLLMNSGKKKLIMKKVLKSLQTFYKDKSLKNVCALTTVFHKIKPIMETRKIRKGSKYYDTPFFLKKARAFSILLRWIAQAIKKGDNLTNSIQKEFKDLIKGLGSTVKESQNLRNKVSINIIYSHYRWR